MNLGYTRIEAPADGTVGERQVRPGQLVSPGTQVIPFVDKTKWVQANYRETQLTNVKVGDPAEIRIDEYPGQIIHGKVIEIAPASGSQFALLPPDNATGNFTKVVQRIPVKIGLDDDSLAAEPATRSFSNCHSPHETIAGASWLLQRLQLVHPHRWRLRTPRLLQFPRKSRPGLC